MKKIICLLISICMLTSSISVALAVQDDEFNMYDEYTINFKDTKFGINNISIDSNMNDEYENNVDKTIKFVKDLKLKEKGYSDIEDKIISDIENANVDGVVIDSFSVNVPKQLRSSEGTYYGEYSGVKFNKMETTLNLSHRMVEYNKKAGILSWLKGTSDIYMCFKSFKVSLPYLIVSSTIKEFIDSQPTSSTKVYLTPKQTVYKKYILIEDVMCKVTPSGNQYATIYVDERDKVLGEFYLSVPGVGHQSEIKYTDTTQRYTDTWNNSKNTILKKCYNKYISSDPISIITNELPSINSSSFSLKN